MERKTILSGSPFEQKVGFARAVRVGNHICVSGTAPITDDGKSACVGDAYGQTKRCLEIIKTAIEKAGATIESVVRTRIFLTDIDKWEEVARAHQEMFNDIKPTSTLLEVTKLIKPEWIVEIEAECIIEENK